MSTDAGARAACADIHALIDAGAPWEACDAFLRARAEHPHDVELAYCGALAQVRAGASHEARALLDAIADDAVASVALLADIHSLRGRLWKDAMRHATTAVEQRDRLGLARRAYLAAWALANDPYPGINAASLAWLDGDHAAAHALAAEVVARIPPAASNAGSAWARFTRGEAALLMGDLEGARREYMAARDSTSARAGAQAGSLASARRQLALLAPALPEAASVLALLPAPAVVAYTGHLVDGPDRAVPRFPAGLVGAVEAAVRDFVAGLHEPLFYGSLACGADLIVAEAALARGAEVNIVLPFDSEDFVRSSVAPGEADWVARYHGVMGRVARVISATREAYLGDDVLFDHAARLVEGLAVLRARQLETRAQLLAVIEPAAEGRTGGSAEAVERWRRAHGPAQVIDIGALRAASMPAARASIAAASVAAASAAADSAVATSAALQAGAAPTAQPSQGGAATPRRSLKTILFADFTGYGRVHDVDAVPFQQRFWGLAAETLRASRAQPLFANTWGDALYLVFDEAADGVDFALALAQAAHDVDWRAFGLRLPNPLRIAVHTGPVFRAFDPVLGRDNYFGYSVTIAARIEPITPPGSVFVSESCAATLASLGEGRFRLEYVGTMPLAKGAEPTRVYQAGLRTSAAPAPSPLIRLPPDQNGPPK